MVIGSNLYLFSIKPEHMIKAIIGYWQLYIFLFFKIIWYLCIESWAIPQSTVRMPTPEASIGPMVDPQPMSFLTTNSYSE